MAEAEFVTPSEFAERTRKTTGTVYHELHQRRWPSYRIGRKVLINWPEALAIIEKSRVPAAGEGAA